MQYLTFLQRVWQVGCYSHCHDFHMYKHVGLYGNQGRATYPFSLLSLALQHKVTNTVAHYVQYFLTVFLPQ